MPPRSLFFVLLLVPCLACAADDVRRRVTPGADTGATGPENPAPDGPAFPSPPDRPPADSAPTGVPDAGMTASDVAAPPGPEAGGGGRDDAAVPADTRSAGDGGGGGPTGDASAGAGGTWNHRGCTQSMLMYPNIDKNMGRFPPGSCPPPESLKAVCPQGSKIKVMGATASTFETGYVHPPEYAIDEYVMTRWSSFSGATHWLRLDLGEEKTFKRLYLLWEIAHAADYDIAVSNDGTTWMSLAQVRNGDGYQDIIDVNGKARYLRMTGIRRGPTGMGNTLYGYSLFDFTVCAESQ
jgi:hypothetical protein